jgi:D-arabinose 1-dehydrogenase-like Zn-dependent alcohol dehydrogenase
MVHDVKCMIERFPLSKVQEAVDSLIAGKPRFRNVLIME